MRATVKSSAPIRIGGGMRVKVLEAMSQARKALRGDPSGGGSWKHNQDGPCFVADDEDQIDLKVSSSYYHPHRRRRLAEEARRWAEFAPPRLGRGSRRLRGTYESLAGSQQP